MLYLIEPNKHPNNWLSISELASLSFRQTAANIVFTLNDMNNHLYIWWSRELSHSSNLPILRLYSLSGRPSHRHISWSLEAVRSGFGLLQSLWNLTGISVDWYQFYWCLALCGSRRIDNLRMGHCPSWWRQYLWYLSVQNCRYIIMFNKIQLVQCRFNTVGITVSVHNHFIILIFEHIHQ